MRLLLLFACFAPSAFGQTLVGTIRGDDALPLPGATVVLLDGATGAQRAGTAADAEGRYQLAAPAPGRYTAVFSFVGRAARRVPVALENGESQKLDVTLTTLALPADEVVVAAGRARVGLAPLTATNVTARDLEALPRAKDLPVLLATKPSVAYYSENGNGMGYTYLRLRGFDERRVAVSINGIPQNDPEDLSVYWINFFDLQGAITDIQVQRGAGTAAYGSAAIAGAINIVADPYAPLPSALLETGYGAFGTYRLTAQANTGLVGGRWVGFGRFSRVRSDGYRDWSWAAFTRFFAGATRYGDQSRLTVQLYGGPQHDALAYYGIAKGDNASDSLRRGNYAAATRDVERFQQPHLEILHEWAPGRGWTLNQTVFGTAARGYFDFDASWRSADYLRLPPDFAGMTPDERQQPLYEVLADPAVQFRAYVEQAHVGYLPRATFERGATRLTLGGELRLNRSLHWGRVQEAAALPPGVVGSGADARVYAYRGEKTIAAAYASLLARPAPRLAVQADVQVGRQQYRFYDDAFFGQHFTTPFTLVNPRVGVTIFPEEAFRLYASLAYGQREPRLKDLYDADEAGAGAQPQFRRRTDGTLDYTRPFVKPERGTSAELGAALERRRARLGLTLYGLFFRDEIVPSGGLDLYGVPRTGNADRTRHVGLELEGVARVAPGLDVEGNATFSRDVFARFTEYEYDGDGNVAARDRKGNAIAGFPAQTYNAALRYRRGAWGARLGAHGTGRIHVDNSGSTDAAFVVDPFVLVDASAQYSLPVPRGLITLSLDVNNVLDAKVLLYGTAPDAFFPAATRHLYAGLRYTLGQ